MAKFVGRVEFPCTIELGKGLEGAITNITRIGYVDGQEGKLVYRGYAIEDLCAHSNYEEVAYLLIYGELPKPAEFDAFKSKLRDARALPDPIKQFIATIPPDAHPMNALQAAVAALGCYDPDGQIVTRHVSKPADALEAERKLRARCPCGCQGGSATATSFVRLGCGLLRQVVDPTAIGSYRDVGASIAEYTQAPPQAVDHVPISA